MFKISLILWIRLRIREQSANHALGMSDNRPTLIEQAMLYGGIASKT